jgi:hypothetical protein
VEKKRLNEIIVNLETVIKAYDEEDIKELLKDFPELKEVLPLLRQYEDELARILKRSSKEVIKEFKALIEGTTDATAILDSMYKAISSDVALKSQVGPIVTALSKKVLETACIKITDIVMKEIDADTAFNKLSPRTYRWIDSWSKELGQIMDNTNYKAVQRALNASIKGGEGIEKTIRRLEELPEFDRKRARATAVTEILTANSVSQQEAYSQSPVVTMKRWVHSGGAKIKPRPAHVAMTDKPPIPVDEAFTVNGYRAMYPRDTQLPAKERVYCHCV